MKVRLLPLLLLPVLACSTPPPQAETRTPAAAAPASPVVDDTLRALVAAFLTKAQTSAVEATQTLGTAAFQQRAVVQDKECALWASEHPEEVPPCGSDRFTFGWQEPLELASVDVVKHAGDTMTVRANMRYREGFLDAPKGSPPLFFAQLDLVRVDGAWRVDDARYDDEAVRRSRGLDP